MKICANGENADSRLLALGFCAEIGDGEGSVDDSFAGGDSGRESVSIRVAAMVKHSVDP